MSEENALMKALVAEYKPGAKNKKNKVIHMEMADPYASDIKKTENLNENETPLMKSFINILNGPGSIERLAFDEDPDYKNQYSSIYKGKLRLLPDDMLKRISVQDSLVASIVTARANMVSAFGRPQPDRFSTGFIIEPEPGTFEKLNEEEKETLQKRIAKAESSLLTCGNTKGYKDNDDCNLGQFFSMACRDAVTFGRMAIEIIWTGVGDGKKFHSFRPMDSGTIYKASPYKNEAEAVRKEAYKILSQVRNKKLIPERFMNDEYAYVQVIHNKPRQAFTADECLVHNFYPATHIELNGYPITPLDTVISDVITHINITTWNKLFFENGRAARGMMIVKSDDINREVISQIKQQFNASINSVSKAFRMPIMGVGQEDEINWIPIDNSSRDMEYQYLSDSNARTILSAFQMSPEEIPGLSHLSRGTNSQSLSESNNEYRMEAHRDVGLRPLLAHFQNFINSKILPLIDPELSKICSFKMVGLDADNAEKEAARIGAEINIHLTMDDILEKVEKKAIGAHLGGKLILNPAWQNSIAPYLTVGYIKEHVFGVKDASKDPALDYIRDNFWFQYQQMRMQAEQAQQQAQAPQQQMSYPGQQPGQPQGGQGQEQPEAQQPDLSSGIDQASDSLSKGELQLSHPKKELLREQKVLIQHFLDGWSNDADEAIKDIVKATKPYIKKKPDA